MVYGIQSASTPACIREILIDDVTRGLQGVILCDHRFHYLGAWHFFWFNQLGDSFIRIRTPHVNDLAPTRR